MISFLLLRRSITVLAAGFALMTASTATAAPITVTVTVQNLAPANGNFLTPVWVGRAHLIS